MKYILSSFFFLLIGLFSNSLQAQTLDLCLAIPEQEFSPGESFSVFLQVSNFTDITGFQFSQNYSTDELQLDNVEVGIGGAIFSEPTPGSMRFIYVADDPETISMPDGSNLVTLTFTALTAIASPAIVVSGEPIEIVAAGIENGVLINRPISLCGVPHIPTVITHLLLCSFGTVGPFTAGEQVEVFLHTTGFTNIEELQFSMNFNPLLFDFNNFQQAMEVSGLEVTEVNPGQLSFVLLAENDEGVTLPDGANNFSIIFDVLDDVQVAEIAITESVVPISGQQLDSDNFSVVVCGEGGGTTGDGTPDICLAYTEGPYSSGEEVTVEVYVTNFRNISLIKLPLSIDWDQLFLSGSVVAGTPTSFGVFGAQSQTREEGLELFWIHWGFIEGSSLPDGTAIMTLTFEVQNDLESLPIHIDPAIGEGVIFYTGFEIDDAGVITICGSHFLNGVMANIVSTVQLDTANNCVPNEGGEPMPGWTLNVTDASGNLNFSTSAGSNGYGYLVLPDGDYSYNWSPPTNIEGWSMCSEGGSFTVTEEDALIRLEGLATPALDCSETYVQLSSSNLRPCFQNNTFFLSYGNYGPQTAEDAYIDLALSPVFSPLSTSLAYTVETDGSYRFELGDLAAGSNGLITITGLIDCDIPIGSTFCATATIAPNGKDCLPPPSAFQGGDLIATAECLGEELRFTVTNVGDGPSGPVGFVVVEDVVIYMQNILEISSGASQSFTVPADGSTLRLVLDRPEAAPYLSHALAIEEGCGNGELSLGFVTTLPLLDDDIWLDRYCQETRAAYDPNDKQALPKGVGEDHLIAPDTKLDYKIRFQNTGNDTAFTVVIRDTINTAVFDISTLELGIGSHPYFLRQENDSILVFTFNNILLPDSTINEPGSHGFVHFSIGQQPDLPDGTRLSNRAGIYFDFNPPIITNDSWHIVGRDITSTSVRNFSLEGGPINVYPNPMEGSLHFEHDQWPGAMTFELYDQLGRQLMQTELLHAGSQISLPELPSGTYSYRLIHAQQLAQTGLLIKN